MTHLTHEQQVFVSYQIRNWILGRRPSFDILNAAWAAHGAQAWFWD